MTREEKGAIIEELSAKLANTTYFYITDASGLTVAQINAFRKMCYDKGIEYKVVKNTLISKALEKLNADYSAWDNTVLKGASGIMFTNESGKLPATLIKEFRSKDKGTKPVFKGASIDSDLFAGDNNLDLLSTLKSKNELVGEIIGLLQSPAKNVIGALQSGGNKLGGILKTLSERQS
jgi:large subunit ribosomal protein L10